MFRFRILLLLVLLPLAAMAAERVPMIAVMPFTGRSVDSDALEGIASALGSDLLNTGKFRVMERSQMESILKEQGFQQSGACDGSECAVEVGKLLAVDHMVVGTVAKVGELYVVTTRLVSVQTGEVVRSVTKNCPAHVEAVVTDLLPQLSQELATVPSTTAPAAAASAQEPVFAPVPQKTVAASKDTSAAPVPAPVSDAASGKSSHWGWWLAGGAVVAGGVAAAVVLTSGGSSSSNSDGGGASSGGGSNSGSTSTPSQIHVVLP